MTTKTIYKYPLQVVDYQAVEMPAGAKILSAQVQRGTLCLWALVDERTDKIVAVDVWIHGTGHVVREAQSARHVGTVQLEGGALVFHVFANVPGEKQ